VTTPAQVTPDDLRRAFDATLAERAARVRVELRREAPAVPPRIGPVRRRLMGALAGRLAEPLVGEGVVDFAGRRCALVYGGAYAVLVTGGEQWSGRPGKELARLPPPEPADDRHPLWLFELGPSIRAVLEAHADEAAGVRAALAVDRDGTAMPLTVWVDRTGLLRRLEHPAPSATLAVDLLELGVELTADWSRLPG